MTSPGRRGIGFGGAVGLGLAAALLITVIAIGRALGRQLTAAMGTVITFAEITLCTILAAVVLAVLGLLAYRGQLALLHLAERRIQLEQLAGRDRPVVTAAAVTAQPAQALPEPRLDAISRAGYRAWDARDSERR